MYGVWGCFFVSSSFMVFTAESKSIATPCAVVQQENMETISYVYDLLFSYRHASDSMSCFFDNYDSAFLKSLLRIFYNFFKTIYNMMSLCIVQSEKNDAHHFST